MCAKRAKTKDVNDKEGEEVMRRCKAVMKKARRARDKGEGQFWDDGEIAILTVLAADYEDVVTGLQKAITPILKLDLGKTSLGKNDPVVKAVAKCQALHRKIFGGKCEG